MSAAKVVQLADYRMQCCISCGRVACGGDCPIDLQSQGQPTSCAHCFRIVATCRLMWRDDGEGCCGSCSHLRESR